MLLLLRLNIVNILEPCTVCVGICVYAACKDGQHNSLQQPSQDIVREYIDQAQIQRAAHFWTFFRASVAVCRSAWCHYACAAFQPYTCFFFLVVLGSSLDSDAHPVGLQATIQSPNCWSVYIMDACNINTEALSS